MEGRVAQRELVGGERDGDLLAAQHCAAKIEASDTRRTAIHRCALCMLPNVVHPPTVQLPYTKTSATGALDVCGYFIMAHVLPLCEHVGRFTCVFGLSVTVLHSV